MALKPEQIDHIAIVTWFNYQFPELYNDFHHFANERKCSFQQGLILKKMGVKRGVSDFFLAIPVDNKSGLWIELKVGKNKPTIEQVNFLTNKKNRGYAAYCVWGFDEAKDLILSYLKNYKSNC